jgi:hypothetical protein
VLEVEQGKGNIFTMQHVAKHRLARRVHEHKRAQEPEPFDLPTDDPNWVARTA